MKFNSITRIALVTLLVTLTGCSRFCSRKTAGPGPGDGPALPGEGREQEQDNRPVVTPNYVGITVTQVVKREMVPGKGKEAGKGSKVSVKFTEWVYDPAALGNQGPKISETLEKPLAIKIGSGDVIKGFEEGLKGMKAGGKRQLIIPATEAYGPEGKPPKIPPNAMVMIDVELLKVE